MRFRRSVSMSIPTGPPARAGRVFATSIFAALIFAGSAPADDQPLRAVRLGPTAAATSAPDGFASVAVFAFNSAEIERGTIVGGGVVVNDLSPGPTLEPGFELGLAAEVVVQGDVEADSILLNRGAQVSGTIFCNQLDDRNASPRLCTSLELPVFAPPPIFQEALVRAGAADVFVGPDQTVTLIPDQSYGDIGVAQGGTLVFAGGVYDVRSIVAAANDGDLCPFPCRSVEFAGATQVRIEGRFEMGKDSYIGPLEGSGVEASEIMLYVGGTNGGDGNPEALPPAAKVGRDSVVAANFYAVRGSLILDKATLASGAFLGRDVRVDAGSEIVLDSFFADRAPVALPQTVTTNGAPGITLTLEGSDPESQDLTFSILAAPVRGTLSTPLPIVPPAVEDRNNPGQLVQPPITQATVIYAPAFPDLNEEDGFTFQVSDPVGGTGMAVVSINPPGDPTTPVVVEEITAENAFAETFRNAAVTVSLGASVPVGVSVSFAVVSEPSFGALSALAQHPPSRATVTYTPDAGFTGGDSFDFEACGLVGGAEQCSTATATVAVLEPQVVAEPQTVETAQDAPVVITLGATPGSSVPLPGAGGWTFVGGKAAFLDPAEIGGNVADADGDGLGDNHNALPGSVPVLMSAAVDAEGGPGSNGVLRMEIEWDVSGSVSPGDLESAQVILHTVKGSVDSLDTFFFVGTANQDGLLTDSDFEAPAQEIPDVVMPVPDVAAGTEGTFSFDVTELLRLTLEQDLGFFSIQGRVDEQLAGTGFQRGLQVRTTATSNQDSFLEPQLAIATPGVVAPPLTFSILSLPESGTLLNAFGTAIIAVPAKLPNATVTYLPATGFTGLDAFTFQVEDSFSGTSATAVIDLVVQVVPQGDCADDEIFCDDGRGD